MLKQNKTPALLRVWDDYSSSSMTVFPASCDKNAKLLFVGLCFFLSVQQRQQIRPNSGTLKKYFASSLLQFSAPVAVWKMTVTKKGQREREKKKVFMHSIPIDLFVKAVIASLRPRHWWILPQRTAGSLNFNVFTLSPRWASEVRTRLSAAPPPRVIVPPAMRSSRLSGTRWGHFAAAVAALSLGWLVSDREQRHS